MNLANLKNILVVSPHPDDSEYSCFGLIKKLNCETTILVCSGGGAGDETNSKDRLSETVEFWKTHEKVKVEQKDFLSLDYSSSVKFLDDYIDRNKFDAIFIPPKNDTNQEHRLMSEICRSSLRNKSATLFEYQTPSTTHDWNPNIWIDIESNLPDKKNMLMLNFKSQLSKPYFENCYLDLFHQDWQAHKRGIKFCEKFKLISWMCK